MTVTTFGGSYAYWHGLGTSKVWVGEQFTSSAELYQEYVTKTEVFVKKVGSPNGSLVCFLIDSGDNTLETLWTINATEITSTTGEWIGTTHTEEQLQGNYTLKFSYTGTYDSSNYIAVNVGAPNQYDGSNSYSRLREGSTTSNNTDNDYLLRITHESTSGGGSGGGGSGGGEEEDPPSGSISGDGGSTLAPEYAMKLNIGYIR